MHSKQLIQKKYFQFIAPGHYIDVQTTDTQWKMARIVEKDKRYIYVSYDGWMNKQQQFFINSYRVAPLRSNTQGYTGSVMKINRNNMPKIQDLKNYIQIAQSIFLDIQKANTLQITQLLRGELFIYVHDLMCKQYCLSQNEIKEANVFLYTFLDLILQIAQRSIEYQQQYFASSATNKLLYLSNNKIALIQSLQELLILLQIIIRTQQYRFVTLFKNNKGIISQQKYAEYFLENKGVNKLVQIFLLNDKNGKWYPSSVRKSIFKIMQRYTSLKVNFQMPKLPKYLVRDYQQFYSIFPLMCKTTLSIELQYQFIDFSINILLTTSSSFDAKLKSMQQLRKILQGKNQLQFVDKTKIIAKIDQMNVLQQLLDHKSFNPEVFKRFVPILNILCKVKALNIKHIHSLFQYLYRLKQFRIVKFRHQSQTSMIFDIISEISQFAPSGLLDNVYGQICKIDINSEQTINFIRTFTIKAIDNLSKEKSYFTGWFGKKKGSSKYGYYGLNMLHKESQDQGRISKQKILYVLNIIKQILAQKLFSEQRWTYLINCVQFIKKKKNYGQSIKLVCLILSTFDENSFFAEDRKKIVQKLQHKYNLVDNIVEGFKSIESILSTKIAHQQCFQYFYDLIQAFSPYVKSPLKVKQIQYLWYKCDSNSLLNFLRKSKPNEKLKKILPPEIIQQIFAVIFKKPSFYKRILLFKEFETIFQLFVSYHLDKDNIAVSMKDGLVRYGKPNLLGMDYFVNYLQHTKQGQFYQKAVKKTIQLILRPIYTKNTSVQAYVEQKVIVWKQFFKKCIQRLASDPKKCLSFIQHFYSSIEGRLYKQIPINDSSNIEILVECDEQQKTISVERFSTIFRLRKLIKEKFKIVHDFDMFNIKLNKTVTFEEQQDYSVNAMPLIDNGRGLTIKVQLKQNKYHQQQLSILFFKKQIEKQEHLYKLIFKIIEEKNVPVEIEKHFWEAIQLLPLNKSMMTNVQKCQKFNFQKWMNYLEVTSDSSLQYKLNIILNLIRESQKWAQKMEETNGLLAIIKILLKKLTQWKNTYQSQALYIKIMEVIEKCYQKCPKKNLPNEILKQLSAKLLITLENQFQRQKKDQGKQSQLQKGKINTSLVLINKTLQIYLSNLKTLMNNNEADILNFKIETFIKILDYGLFKKKTQNTQKFAEEVAISLNFAVFKDFKERKIILQYLIQSLNLPNLIEKERTQNYFKFLITVLYSFQEFKNVKAKASMEIQKDTSIKDEKQNSTINQSKDKECIQQNQMKVQKICLDQKVFFLQQYLENIMKFVNQILQNQDFKDGEKNREQIIYGSLSLLKFILSKSNEQLKIDRKQIFKKLIDCFVFPISQQNSKRIKIEKNKKILFEILKKISFQQVQVVNIIMDKLRPFLQVSKYRKNTMLNWNLHFQNSQKKYFVGLQNLGATCYINCLFQQLFMITSFRQRFISIDSRSYKENLDKNQIYQLQKLFYSLKYNDRKFQTTKQFCSSFITFEGQSINPLVQSDADEFFNTLMDKIETFLKNTGKHDILQKTFEGKLSNQLNCEGCPHRSQKIQSFMSIGVNLKNKKTLQQALKGYVEGEILDGDNAYFCQICQKKVRTLKRLCIKQLPNILVIILKRFEYDFDTYKKIKINSFLQFPDKLNMAEFTSQYLQNKSMEKLQTINAEQNQKIINKIQLTGQNFHLRGTVIHAGNADAGHYYSFIKQKQKWYQFNDDYVNEINYSKVKDQGYGGDQRDSDQFKMQKYKNAYILFYEKQPSSEQSIQKSQKSVQKFEKQIIMQPTQQIEVTPSIMQNDFYKDMADKILQQNHETNIFSSLLQSNFIHFWQNLSISQDLEVMKFILLYFHTVILRDKLRYQYATNYFRIIIKYLSTKTKKQSLTSGEVHNEIATWFLHQINKSYVKQFLIEAPKTVRFVCASLVLTALSHSPTIPQKLTLIFVSSLRKNSMSPLGLIIKALSKRKEQFIKLQELKYCEIILSLVLNQRKIQQLQLPILINQNDSYFGADCSQGPTQRQKCSSALLESLEQFNEGLSIEILLRLNQSYSFRKSNKVILKKVVQIMCKQIQTGSKHESDIHAMIKMFEQRITATNCGKEHVQKYLLFMRYLVWQVQQKPLKAQVQEFVIDSFKTFIVTSSKFYEPMDWIMRQITKIASRNLNFKNSWKTSVLTSANLKLQIQSWLKQVEKPQYINIKDDFFQKLRQMDFKQKIQYLKKYVRKMRDKINWMLNDQQTEEKEQESDFQMTCDNQFVHIRNKTFKIRQKFEQSIVYYVSYPGKDEHSLWAYLQKNQIQTFNNL